MSHCRLSRCCLLTSIKHCKLKRVQGFQNMCKINKTGPCFHQQARCFYRNLSSIVISRSACQKKTESSNNAKHQHIHDLMLSGSLPQRRCVTNLSNSRPLENILINEAESNHYVFEKNKSYHKWIMSVEPQWLIDKRQQTQKQFDITMFGGKLLPNFSMFETLLKPVTEEVFSFRDIADLLWKLSWLPTYQLLSLIKVEKFQNLMSKLSENLTSLTDEELFVIMKCLSALPFRRAVAKERTLLHEDFVMRLSDECLHRMSGWDMDTCLWVADAFFWLRAYPPVYNSKSYLHEIVAKMQKDLHSLNHNQVVLAIFYISLIRKCPQEFLLDLERKVLEFWSQYSIVEKGNACIGFFKAEHKVRSQELLLKIVGTLRNNLVQMDDLMLGGVCKLVNHSLTDNLSAECIYKLMYSVSVFLGSEKLLTRIPLMNIVTVWRLMKLASTVSEASVPFLEGIKYVVKTADVAKWRLKDICWIVFLLGKFQVAKEEPAMRALLYDKLFEELHKDRRLSEMQSFPYCLPLAIMGFIHMEIYPSDLMDIVMDKDYIQLLKEKEFQIEENAHDLIFLSESLKLEFSNYHGNTLDSNENVSRGENEEVESTSGLFSNNWNRERFTKIVDKMLQDILCSPGCTKVHYLLPYSKTPDLEIRFDENKQPIPVAKWKDLSEERVKTSASCSDAREENSQSEDTIADSATSSSGNSLQNIFLQMKEPSLQVCKYRLAILVNAPHWYFCCRDGVKERLQLFGYHVTRRRQLEKKGFMTVEVNPHLFSNLYKKSHRGQDMVLEEALTESIYKTLHS